MIVPTPSSWSFETETGTVRFVAKADSGEVGIGSSVVVSNWRKSPCSCQMFDHDAMIETAILAKRGTDFVVSLESALRMHDFTTVVPHALWIARYGQVRPVECISSQESACFGNASSASARAIRSAESILPRRSATRCKVRFQIMTKRRTAPRTPTTTNRRPTVRHGGVERMRMSSDDRTMILTPEYHRFVLVRARAFGRMVTNCVPRRIGEYGIIHCHENHSRHPVRWRR